MYLSDDDMAVLVPLVQMELLRRGQTEADLPYWNGMPWPTGRDIWRVGSIPSGLAEVAALDGRPANLCRMLRIHFDREEDAPWAFVSGETGVLVLRMTQSGQIDTD